MDIASLCVSRLFNIFAQNYTWHLQFVVNERVSQIVGGVPKVCYVELCWKPFWSQQNTIIDIDLQIFSCSIQICNVRMRSIIYPPSLKFACPFALTPFKSAHQLLIFSKKTIEFAKDCAKHYGPTIDLNTPIAL